MIDGINENIGWLILLSNNLYTKPEIRYCTQTAKGRKRVHNYSPKEPRNLSTFVHIIN